MSHDVNMKITEVVDFNPKRPIKKSTIAPFIDMASLPTTSRDIENVTKKEFKGGGAKFKNGDTLFARITPCLENGKTAKVSGLSNDVNGFGSTEFIVMSPKDPEFDEDYVYYLARLPELRTYAKARMAGTSGRQRVSWQSLAEFEYSFPSKHKRKLIGDFLRSIDDKITINNQMNSTLEKMAQAIYASWFVNFDPVKAKMNGERPQGLDNTVSKLFPDKLVDSEAGQIPEDWEVKKLEEIADFQNGFAFYTEGYSESGYSVVDLGNISSEGKFIETRHDKYISNDLYKLPKHHKHQLNKNDLVMAMTDITQAMGILGKTGKIPESGKYILNQRVGRVRCKADVDVNFMLTSLNSSHQLHFLKARALGSVQKYVNTKHILRMEFVMPSLQLMECFGGMVQPLFDRIHENDIQNQHLAKLRDTILPDLLSGKVNLNEV